MVLETDKLKWVVGKYDLPEAYFKIVVPSVTTILTEMIPDPDLEKWKIDVGEEKAKEISEAAGNRGTAMHTFIEQFIIKYTETKDPTLSLKYTQVESQKLLEQQHIPQDKIDIGRNLFYNFYHSEYVSNFKNIVKTELPIYSKSYVYRGKFDALYTEPLHGYCIVDFKTSNSLIKKDTVKEKKYKLQCAAYCIAVEEMFQDKNIKINKSSIMCINTKNDYVQNIEILNDELQSYKEEFKTLIKEYHNRIGQTFLNIK